LYVSAGFMTVSLVFDIIRNRYLNSRDLEFLERPEMKRPVTRRDFIKALGSGAAALSPQSRRPRKRERKADIVLIVVDDSGWEDADFQGSTSRRPPSLDSLAGQSRSFRGSYHSVRRDSTGLARPALIV
jgi:hypothetical protein